MAATANRVLLWALAVSLAAHLLLIGAAADFGFTPAVELSFPIEASLAGPEPLPPPVRPPVPSRAPAPVVEPPAPEPAPVVETAPEPARPPEPKPERPTEPAPVAPPAPPPPPAIQAAPLRAAVRNLPDDLVIRYNVQTGEAGFVAGRATYIWHRRDGRYSLVSTLEATGLAALFISGRIVQVSEGMVDGAGLHPAQYHLQRNERRQDVARFNWGTGQLVMEGRGGATLAPQAQDLLSFPFHLAMTVREGEPGFLLGVTNGRKYNEFAFRVLGHETMELAGQSLEVLHLQGEKPGEGTLDVWLDTTRSGLPMRVRTLDRKGKAAEMRFEGMETPERGSGDQP